MSCAKMDMMWRCVKNVMTIFTRLKPGTNRDRNSMTLQEAREKYDKANQAWLDCCHKIALLLEKETNLLIEKNNAFDAYHEQLQEEKNE